LFTSLLILLNKISSGAITPNLIIDDDEASIKSHRSAP